MNAKKVLAGVLSAALLVIATDQSMCRIPELMQSKQGAAASYSFFLPDSEEEMACAALAGGAKSEQGQQRRILIPGGQSIGLSLTTEGVFIVEAADVILSDGSSVNPAKDAGLTSGDCILRINNRPIASMEMLTAAVQEADGALNIEYMRDGKAKTTTVMPVRDESGIPRIGIWVRDSTAGIGTMTYLDPQTMGFGALGHAVTDVDTGRLLPIETGDVYLAQIMEVKKGAKGEAGELHGVFTGKWDAVRSLTRNTISGVFGQLAQTPDNPLYPQGLPIAEPEELHTGKATILTTVDAKGIREFDCEILRINPQLTKDPRSMVLRITDPELLAVTGGIVQGMSGSPIIQNGKLVGAVTHVLVNDPTRGYGIFIENMLDAAG